MFIYLFLILLGFASFFFSSFCWLRTEWKASPTGLWDYARFQ
jgi:hypothetical protein